MKLDQSLAEAQFVNPAPRWYLSGFDARHVDQIGLQQREVHFSTASRVRTLSCAVASELRPETIDILPSIALESFSTLERTVPGLRKQTTSPIRNTAGASTCVLPRATSPK